jgi:acetylglutamate kinase
MVVKLGGRVQSDGRLIEALQGAWVASPGSYCVVHGGGDEVSSLQRQLGREPAFIDGRRVTTAADIELVRMVLSGSANKRLVSALDAAGLPAVGVSGEDAGLLKAIPIDEARFGRAGKPVSVNGALIETLLEGGYLPVISPVAADATSDVGAALNVNGDDAAAAIASALHAELWMVADVPGVMDGNGRILDRIDEETIAPLIRDGTVTRGMLAKLEAGFAALDAGTSVVRICSLNAFSDEGTGTFLTTTPSLT